MFALILFQRFLLGLFFVFLLQKKKTNLENLTQSTGTQQDSWKIDKILTFWKWHCSPLILLPHPAWVQEFLKHGIFKQLKE